MHRPNSSSAFKKKFSRVSSGKKTKFNNPYEKNNFVKHKTNNVVKKDIYAKNEE